MQTEKLAPVFIDNQPVNLQDPNPKVSAILTACGLPDATGLKWVQFQPVNQGRTMRPDETLDRTSEPTKPIYLTSAVDGKFAGATVLRSKGNPAGGQPTASGSSGPSSGSQKQAYGSGGQSQQSQKGGGSQESSGTADAAGHGPEWRRTGQRPEPASQRNKPEHGKPEEVEGSAEAGEGIEADDEDGKKSES